MLSNENLCLAFVNGSKSCIHNGSMSISADGTKLLSYNTTIAERVGKKFIINVTKYSVTTSRHQSLVRYLINRCGYDIKNTTKYVPINTQRLGRYV